MIAMNKKLLSPCTIKQYKPARTMQHWVLESNYQGGDAWFVRSVPSLLKEIMGQRGHEMASIPQLLAALRDHPTKARFVTYAAVFFALKRHPHVFGRYNPLQNGTVCYHLI